MWKWIPESREAIEVEMSGGVQARNVICILLEVDERVEEITNWTWSETEIILDKRKEKCRGVPAKVSVEAHVIGQACFCNPIDSYSKHI